MISMVKVETPHRGVLCCGQVFGWRLMDHILGIIMDYSTVIPWVCLKNMMLKVYWVIIFPLQCPLWENTRFSDFSQAHGNL
jgi:hypothetical protein